MRFDQWAQYIKYQFGIYTFKCFKSWVDINYKIFRTKIKLSFLKECKTNDLVPSHLNRYNTSGFHLHHRRSLRRMESLHYRFRKNAINIEIFDLHRQIPFLQRRLVDVSLTLSNNLPFHIK